jgi:hypothetical protein
MRRVAGAACLRPVAGQVTTYGRDSTMSPFLGIPEFILGALFYILYRIFKK